MESSKEKVAQSYENLKISLDGKTYREYATAKKDFLMRIKISRKEAKESRYWLQLVDVQSGNISLEEERKSLLQEATELMMILSAIMRKSS